MIIYYLLISVLLLIICFICGTGIRHLIKGIDLNSILTGFMFLISLFYLIALPFMYIHGSMLILSVIYVSVVSVLFIYSIYVIIKNKLFLSFFKKPDISIYLIISLVLIVVHLLVVVIRSHVDIDDSFYISQTTTILKSGLINPYETSTGISTFPFYMQYAMVGHEVMYALLCNIFHVNAALLYHTIMPVFLIILHYLMIYETVSCIRKKHADIMLLIIVIINFMSGYSVYSSGSFAMIRIWQGKAVLVSIILPFVMYIFINIFKKAKIETVDLILVFVSIMCGMYASTVGLYIAPFSCAVYSAAYLLSIRNKKQLLNFCKLIIPAVLSGVVAVIIYKVLRSGADLAFLTAGADDISYIEVIKKIMGNGFIPVVYLLSVIYFIVFGKGFMRYVFGIQCLVCFVTILNPFICGFVAKNITGTDVYWRLFWILQMNICIAACIGDIAERVKKRILVFAAGAIAVCLSGSLILFNGYYTKADNYEKISKTEKDICDAILVHSNDHPDDNIRLLLPEGYCYGIRQYTGNIELAWSRYSRVLYENAGNIEDVDTLMNDIYIERKWDKTDYNIVKELGINYIIIYKTMTYDKEYFPSGIDSGTIWEDEESCLVELEDI